MILPLGALRLTLRVTLSWNFNILDLRLDKSLPLSQLLSEVLLNFINSFLEDIFDPFHRGYRLFHDLWCLDGLLEFMKADFIRALIVVFNILFKLLPLSVLGEPRKIIKFCPDKAIMQGIRDQMKTVQRQNARDVSFHLIFMCPQFFVNFVRCLNVLKKASFDVKNLL